MSDCQIIQADFAVTLARVAEQGGADLILMSPPYPGKARTYGQEDEAAVWTLADYQRLGDAVKHALKPGGHCLMVLDAPVREWRKGYGTERGFLPWQVMLDWAERVGLRVPDRLAYGRYGLRGAYAGRFRNDWEPLLWAQRTGGGGYFDKASLLEPGIYDRGTGYTVGSRRDNGSLYRRLVSGHAAENNLVNRSTLWWYGDTGNAHDDWRGEESEHPARFCQRFAEDAVRCFAPPQGLVCDPFTGSGTSAVAAVKHGRRFFGGDLLIRPSDGKPWAEVAMERVTEAARQQQLFGVNP